MNGIQDKMHPFVQENIQKLLNNGFKIVAPEVGYLACGTEGIGRLADINTIFEKTVDAFEDCKKLLGKRIVVTAGGTIEEIDPVRYISNYSSGKMGIALADVAASQGAEVVLIATVDVNRKYNVVKVKYVFTTNSGTLWEFTKCYLFYSLFVAINTIRNLPYCRDSRKIFKDK